MIQINSLFLFYGGEFSNFYDCSFTIDGIVFNTSEQYFMYRKALHFNDFTIAEKILKTKNPYNQKKYGRQVKGFDNAVWVTVRYQYMLDGCTAKFTQNPNLMNILLNTKNLHIVEASPSDTIWGVGLGIDNPDILFPEKWQGLNLLGEVLMQMRNNVLLDYQK